MKNTLRKLWLYRQLDDFTNTNYGRATTALACLIAIAMIWYWRTLK